MLDAEVRIGELMAATPKAANQYARDSGVTRKTDALKQAGFTGSDEKIRQMAHRFETLAAHPEIVAQPRRCPPEPLFCLPYVQAYKHIGKDQAGHAGLHRAAENRP